MAISEIFLFSAIGESLILGFEKPDHRVRDSPIDQGKHDLKK